MNKNKSRREFIKKIGLITSGMLSLPFITSCSKYIDYTPYRIKIDAPYGQTNKNLSRIRDISNGEFKPFKIAIISDTHTFYDNFNKAVESINNLDDIDFVVHAGDLTLSAITKEFEWFSEIINKINVPVINVIGNHDYLANGVKTYENLLGDLNFTFVYNNCKFVIFDNVSLERNTGEADFKWFDDNLKNDNSYNHVIPISHIPPWTEQFSTGEGFYFNNLLEKNDVKLSIHGHTHSFSYDKRYDSVDYLVVNDIDDRQYVVLEVLEKDFKVDIIKF